MTTNPIPPAAPHGIAAEHHKLSSGLGVGSIVFMVVAGAAPLTAVVAGWPVVVSVSQSTASPLFFVIATVILVLFSVGFTRMSPYVKNAGAFYSFIQAGLGRAVGLGSSTFALGTYLILFLALAAYLGDASRAAIVYFGGPDTPWWAWSIGFLVLSGLLAYRDVDMSAKVLGVLLVLETLVVIVVDVAVIAHGGGPNGLNAASLSPARLGDGVPTLGIMFAFFSFIGFEATAVFRTEARDPDRTVPRATYIAVISVGVFYAFTSWALQAGVQGSVVDEATNNPTQLVFSLATTYVSPVLRSVMEVFLVTSLFACILTFQNVLTRYLYTLGGQGVLHRRLGDVHAKHKSPARASLVVTVLGIVMTGVGVALRLDPVTEIYTWLSGAATFGVIVLMALTSLAVIVFFRTKGAGGPVWSTIVAPVAAFLGLGAVAVVVTSNFDLLVGGPVPAGILLSVMGAFFLVGLITCFVLRARTPHVFEALLGGDEETDAPVGLVDAASR